MSFIIRSEGVVWRLLSYIPGKVTYCLLWRVDQTNPTLSYGVVEAVFKSYLETQTLDAVSRKLLLEIIRSGLRRDQ